MEYGRSQAIILQTRRWSESSSIVTALTLEFGKIGWVSKGARRPKHFAGKTHQPGTRVDAIWIDQPQRDLLPLVTLDEVDPVEPETPFVNRINLLRLLRIVKRTTEPLEPHPNGYRQLARTLAANRFANRNESMLLFWQFILRWFSELGFAIDLNRCGLCGCNVKGTRLGFAIEEGHGICERCAAIHSKTDSDTLFGISGEAFALMKKLECSPESALSRLTVSTRSEQQINLVCDRYLRYHTGVSLHSPAFASVY